MLNSLHNQPHIVKQAGPGAFCHWWVTKVELLSITGYGQLHLHSLCSRRKEASAAVLCVCVCVERRGGRRSLVHPSAPGRRGPEAAGAFVRQTGSGTLRWSSLLQNASQLIDWDAAVTSRPSATPLWIAPLCYLVSPLAAAIYHHIHPRLLICETLHLGVLLCPKSALINLIISKVTFEWPYKCLIAVKSMIRLICFCWTN